MFDPAALRGADDEIPVLEDLEPFVIAGDRLPEGTSVGRPCRVDEVAEDHPVEAPGQRDVSLLDEPTGGLVGRVAYARVNIVGARRLEAAHEGLEVAGVVEIVVVEHGNERRLGLTNARVQSRGPRAEAGGSDAPQRREPGRETVEHLLDAAIAHIHDDDLEVVPRLNGEALERVAEAHGAERPHHDGNRRRRRPENLTHRFTG